MILPMPVSSTPKANQSLPQNLSKPLLTPIPKSQESAYQRFKERSSLNPRLKLFSEGQLRVLFLRLESEERSQTL